VLRLERGAFRWRMGVTPDGRLPATGAVATFIQWEGGLHPADFLPASGCVLERFERNAGTLAATFRTPAGTRTISSSRE